MTLQSTFLM